MVCVVCVVGISSLYFFTIKQNSLRTLEKMFMVEQVTTSPAPHPDLLRLKSNEIC